MRPSIRIGAVNFLNTKPLIEGLERFAPDARLFLEEPSRLADALAAGELEIGLIPAIEYFRSGNYRMFPEIGICSAGPVLSVTLFSRRPWAQIRRLALDPGSRTSALLVRILSQERYAVRPELCELRWSASAEDTDADGVLLIGDRAMRACLPGFAYSYDLGQEWHTWTGLPFVYAFWAVRPGVQLGSVAQALVRAKELGISQVGEIAFREAPRLGLDAGFCRRYLSHIIHFDIGPRELEGLKRFYALACQLRLVPPGVEIEFYNQTQLIKSR